MKIILWILTCGFLCIVSFVLFFVYSHSKKSQKYALASCLIFLFITTGTIIYSFIKVINKTIDAGTSFGNTIFHGAAEGVAESYSDNREFLSDGTYDCPQIRILKSYVPDSLKGEENRTFYTYFGFRDFFRFPLVYPYSIQCIDNRSYGTLCNERLVKDIIKSSDGTIQTSIKNIVAFEFDKQCFIAETNNSDNDSTSYEIFIWVTKKTTSFKSKDLLMKEAYKQGFTKSDTLITMQQYDDLFYK